MSTTPTKPNMGLKERILSASSSTQISALILEGQSYQHASPSTKRSWKRAASRRNLELK